MNSMDTLSYKGFEGTTELDMARGLCHGKLLFINDLVTYEAKSPADLQKEFEAAVDDYIETCNAVGKEPQRPFKGLFNVRIAPELHRDAVLRATKDGVFLNDIVNVALQQYLYHNSDTKNIHITYDIQGEITGLASQSQGDKWYEPKEVRLGN